MKSFLLGAFMLLISIPSFAQSALAPVDTTIKLSASPSAMELTKLFTETAQGLHDPFIAVNLVATKGNKAVPGLRGFLSNTPMLRNAVTMSDGTVDSVAVPLNRVYGVMALDLIGTPEAYKVLSEVAQNDTNPDVRGEALKFFAMSFYYKTTRDSLSSPDNQVVHLLLRSSDDTVHVGRFAMRIGDIARQGLKNWTGIDYGDVPPDSIKAREEQRLGMTIQQYREQWWQQNSGKMTWNKATGHFEIKK